MNNKLNLTDNEKRDIIKYLEAGKPLPERYRFLLFDMNKRINDIDLVKKIETKAYWYIRIDPCIETRNMESNLELEEFIKQNIVKILVKDFPDLSGKNRKLESGYEVSLDDTDNEFFNNIHIWQLFRDGSFIIYDGLYLDWNDVQDSIQNEGDSKTEKIGISSMLFYLTILFRFASNLIKNDFYKDGIRLEINLCNIKDRELFVDNPRGTPFSYSRSYNDVKISYVKEFRDNSIQELIMTPDDESRLSYSPAMDNYQHVLISIREHRLKTVQNLLKKVQKNLE